ncbi:MAG: DUF4352 domain-containing protein [Candidatus Saccharimonadales bacterium]
MTHQKKLRAPLATVRERYLSFSDHKIFLISCALFVLSIFTLGSALLLVQKHDRLPSNGIRMGVDVRNGSSELQVYTIEHRPGTQQFPAPKGYEYVVVTLKVKNVGERPFSVLPTNDTYIKTSDGHVSYVSAYELEAPFRAGLILPGESTRGELSYLVPKQANYKFYVESSWTATAIPFMVQLDASEPLQKDGT